MAFVPRFEYSHAMVRRLMAIDATRALIDVLAVPPEAALMMRFEARRASTHYSTSIEGNELGLDEVRRALALADRTGSRQQQEVRNYWRALEWVERQIDEGPRIDEVFIRRLHAIIDGRGRGRRTEQSDYRTEECPVVDRASGVVEYGPPTPEDVPALMADLVSWLRSQEAAQLPGPIRAAILAYRFVTIHPFPDGNGRTARALATAELWFSGYWMRGFLSVEEHYYRDLQRYYASLQMGLPVDYYEGRHDADLTPWLEYFVETLAVAADGVHERALALWARSERPEAPWEGLGRRQQQIVARLVTSTPDDPTVAVVTPGDVAAWFGVSTRTARAWLHEWHAEGFVEPAKGTQRISTWRLAPEYLKVVEAVRSAISE